jgi:hypothetical protein
MRLALALAALIVAAGPAIASPMPKAQAARLAFLSELAPHSCSEFEEDLSAHAGWMIANGLLHADLYRINNYGKDIVEELQKFETDMTNFGPKDTCDKMFKLLGPSGFGLVKP